MEGVQDITRVNNMISVLKEHNLGLPNDQAYDQAQSMVLGEKLTQESELTQSEREVQALYNQVNSMRQEMAELQETSRKEIQKLNIQMASFNQQLQDAVRAAVAAHTSRPPEPAPPKPEPVPEQQQTLHEPKEEPQQPAAEPEEPGFDPSVESIFYCGNK